jgi:hypothetical protein
MASRSPPPPPAQLDRIDLPVVTVDPGELLRLFPIGSSVAHSLRPLYSTAAKIV